MRSFIVACSILTAVILTVILDSLYVSDTVSELSRICNSMNSENSADSTEVLLSEWRSCKDILSLTVHGSEIAEIDNALISLSVHEADSPEFRCALNLIRNLFEQILERSKPSLFTLF